MNNSGLPKLHAIGSFVTKEYAGWFVGGRSGGGVMAVLFRTREAPPRKRWPGLFAVWRDRAKKRRQLAAMRERDLKDIGLTRLDAAREVRKPFWRE
jgi:uncharacterized protein YjiS (DUF1127 family)